MPGTPTDLLDRFRPTMVRHLDPDPDPEYHDYSSKPGTGSDDHHDYTASASFAVQALAAYTRAFPERAVVTESYRGYSNAYWPHNLSAADFAAKQPLPDIYGGEDDTPCTMRNGCGDHRMGNGFDRMRWPQSMQYGRRTARRTWWACGSLSRRRRRISGPSPGARLKVDRSLRACRRAPRGSGCPAGSARSRWRAQRPAAGGRTVAARNSDGGEPAAHRPGGRPRAWQQLGGTIAHVPAAAVDASGGRLVVAAPRSDGRLVVAREPNPGAPLGPWSAAGA
ncbi:hypothetical protein ACPA54_02690 [Uniformispora flossi]|uniref:hypothetical protein n=1 Tax=Uniformispora flossi TaxID=3390723 RepID=UPI003C302808